MATPSQDVKDKVAPETTDSNKYPTTADGYEVYQEIGAGAFAKVYRAKVKATGEEVAIKVMDLEQFNTNWDEIRKEISIMRSLQHDNVVKIHCSFVDEQDLWIVMPLLAAGSCASIMKAIAQNGFKDEVLIATILREALQGLQYFHKDGRIHRDIKAGNILIGAEGNVELADFGVAGTLMENGDRKKTRQTFTGTPCWMAPEVMEQSNGYDTKADVWSFGITAMELGYGRAPYSKYQPMKVLLLTLQEEPPTCEIYQDNAFKFSKNFHGLISKCLRKDPTKRPTAKKLLEHEFFKQAKDAAYIVDKVIKKLPAQAAKLTQPIQVGRRSRQGDGNKSLKGPVAVESWSFDRAAAVLKEAKALTAETPASPTSAAGPSTAGPSAAGPTKATEGQPAGPTAANGAASQGAAPTDKPQSVSGPVFHD